MEIRAKVALSLPNTFYKVILKYDTFEKATFDSYLIASLIANSKNEKEAFEYIDEITGKGSLNTHFKKLYNKMTDFTKEQIDGIIKNSLFPVTVIDQKNHFKYYPMFDATRMNDKVYDGNLRDNEEFLKSMIMPKGDSVKFLSIDYVEEPGTLKTDNYNAVFSDKEIRVDLDNGQYYPISKENFSLVHNNDDINLDYFFGNVGTTITEGNWNVLSKSIADTFSKSNYVYSDSDGIHSVLFNDCIKTTEIIKVFDLYFYKDTRYDFSKKNAQKCNDALKYLLESKDINEYKTKSLLSLLSIVDERLAQDTVVYVLSRKSSKEISEFGLSLIKQGLEKGWDRDILLTIKNDTSKSDYKYLYKIDNSLNFEVEDLLLIDDDYLTQLDKRKKTNYLTEKDNILKEINTIIGEITNSGIRESIKSLPKSELKEVVKKFVDKRIGHSKKNYSNMNLEQLKNEYKEIGDFYSKSYKKILKEIEANKAKL